MIRTVVSPRPGITQLPLINEPPTKAFDLQKYKTAAITILKTSRINELKKLNRTVLACVLPSEVLQRIFIACAQLTVNLPTWSWVSVTFVCSTWRQAALSSWELWSYVDFSHPKWTSLTLYRAQTLPVNVKATVNADNQRSLHYTLLHAPRIRNVHLTSSLHNIGPLIRTLHSPNYFLESLVINISQPDDIHDIRYSKRFSNGSPVPSLKYLELHRAPISLVSLRYTGLTHLSLHHLPLSERPTRRDFLSLLEGFTILQHLTLEQAFPRNVINGNVNTRSIRLPNLLSITLSGSMLDLTNILEFITLQPTCQLRCHVDRMGDFKAGFWKLARVLGAHFHNVSSEIILNSLALTGREQGLRFTETHELNPEFRQTLRIRAFGYKEFVEPLLDLFLAPDLHTFHDEIIIASLMSVLEALPLNDVHTLTLQCLDVITHRTWPKLLPSLRSLRILNISGHPPSGLLWALLLNARSYSHRRRGNIDALFLPNLEDIYVDNVDCFAGGLMISPSASVNSHCDLDDSRFLEVLHSYLEDRQRCGFELRNLCISRCENISRTLVDKLGWVMSYLSWDGRGLYKEETSGDVSSEFPATYRRRWPSAPPLLRHYFRLRMLVEIG